MSTQIEDWKHLNFPVRPEEEEAESKDSPKEFKEEDDLTMGD